MATERSRGRPIVPTLRMSVFLGALCVLVVCGLLSCSRNEYTITGPKPEAPKNARKAEPVKKEAGAGMNPMPPAAPQAAEPSK